MLDPCAQCEEMLQPYLDHALNTDELRAAEAHLNQCSYCRKRYRFEENLRHYVRVAATEPMRLELKQRLSELRTPLY